MNDAPQNRHPVDELAEVRDAIRRLKERDDQLRGMIIDQECSRTGDEHVAIVEFKVSERMDTQQVLRDFGRDRMRRYLKRTRSTYVSVRPKPIREAST